MPLPTDPMLAQQWHLRNSVAGLLDLNLVGVWDPAEGPAYTGAGTRTVVIDDGFDYNHPDFDNYNVHLDYDFHADVLDAIGTATDSHGTAVAGIIGAAADGVGTVGVAFGTELVGYRGLLNTESAIHHAAMSALGDVVNMSIGWTISSTFATDAQFATYHASVHTAVTEGRGGLGTTIVKIAHNFRADFHDVGASPDSWNTQQVIVAAVDQTGFVSSYSSYGSSVLVSGFGTPGEVVTADRLAGAGYSPGDFTDSFNGTSSAAPMVSGVVALMYEANAGLGWRDVQSILASSARHVGSAVGGVAQDDERFAWSFNGARTWNGGGLHHSNDYGFGLVDAWAAVRLAESWLLTGAAASTSSNQATTSLDLLSQTVTIPDGNLTGRSFSGTIASSVVIDRMAVQLTFATTWISDLEVYLISPSGTESRLLGDMADSVPAQAEADFRGTWTFESQAFRGEQAAGAWKVKVVDDTTGDTLTVSDVIVRAYGSSTVDDRYTYTNEYSDYAGRHGHNVSVSDGNGGRDTVNAAAVTAASVIRLDGGASRIDNVATTFSQIEHAIGGEAGDILIGNGGANKLFGMRGADTLNGGAGTDTMFGGSGNDTYVVGQSTDKVFETTAPGSTIDAGGNDTVQSGISWSLGALFENLSLLGTSEVNATGNGRSNRITGNGSANTLLGLGGNDRLDGGAGTDRLEGGAGNDTYVLAADADMIVELAGGGTDLVQSAVSHTLAANVDRLLLTGGANLNGTGNDLANKLTGNGAANRLSSLGANDTLLGDGGNDRLHGGAGVDRLTGGLGNDVIVFTSLAEAGDVITDFRNVSGDNDSFALRATAFGTGLAAGVALTAAQFQVLLTGSVTATTAGTSQVRFLWEADDERLWSDTNGSGTGGLVLLADLQDGASLGQSDLVLV